MSGRPAGERLRALGAAARAGFGREPFLAMVSLLALLYVAAALSPSSYAMVLRSFGVADDGLLLGEPQYFRSDEYAIWTPTVQAAVASDFGPVNVTSLYGERFRSLSALPLADWGIVFKPAFWSFFALSPARAFSAYHAFHYWAFMVGWVLLLRQLGISRIMATGAALLLLGSSWVQIWWTSLGPILVYAPFFVLPLLLPWRGWARGLAAFYVAAAWLLDGLFYPPLYLAASLVLLLAIFAFRPESLRPVRLLPWAAGALAGIGVAGFYLREPILATARTAMHGARSLGGGAVPWQDFAGTFLPAFPYHGWQALYGGNSCEASATGSILWLLILFFALPSSLGQAWQAGEERERLLRAGGLVLLFLLATVWMLAPVPAVWGKILLWHLAPPSRLLLLPGLAALFLALLLLPRLELRWSLLRASLFSFLVLGFFLYAEWDFFGKHPESRRSVVEQHLELLLIPLVFALPLLELARRRFLPASDTAAGGGGGAPASWRRLSPAVLVAASAAANLLFFGLFNPLQSSRAIFAHHDSEELRALRAMQEADPRGWLVAGAHDYYGSVLNGLGFRSVNHSLLNPDLDRFAHFFPDLPAEERNRIFNRYLNVQVSPFRPPNWNRPLLQPVLPIDNGVLVPPEPFLVPLPAKVSAAPPPASPPAPGGGSRAVTIGPKWWLLEIEGPIGGIEGDVGIEIHTDPPARRLIRTWRLPPPDVPGAMGKDLYSRVQVELAAPPGFSPQKQEGGLGWCIVLEDPVAGRRQIAPDPGAGRSICR